METKTKYNKAKTWEWLLFSTSDIATNSVFLIMNLQFLIYCTDFYGFNSGVVGIIMVATRLLDAVTDPIIGMMVDRTDSKLGKFRPWILMGSIITNIAFFTIFFGFDFGSKLANMIFIVVMYCIFVIGYTFQSTVTKSGQTILTNDSSQRTNINAVATLGTMILYVAISSVFMPMIAGTKASNINNWHIISWSIIAVQLFLSMLSFIGISGKDKPQYYIVEGDNGEATEKPKLSDYKKILMGNKALQSLVVAASSNKFAANAITALSAYFFFYVVRDSDLEMMGTVSVVQLLFTIAGIIIAMKLTAKLGRKSVVLYSSLFAAIWGVVAILILSFSVSFVAVVIAMGINYLLSNAKNVNINPMVADCADYEVYQGGKFVPGMVGTSFSFIDKVVSSVGTGSAGILLAILGYESMETTAQTDTMFWGILLFFFLVPAIGHLFGVYAMKKYPITPEVYEDMVSKRSEQMNDTV